MMLNCCYILSPIHKLLLVIFFYSLDLNKKYDKQMFMNVAKNITAIQTVKSV